MKIQNYCDIKSQYHSIVITIILCSSINYGQNNFCLDVFKYNRQNVIIFIYYVFQVLSCISAYIHTYNKSNSENTF